MNRRHGVRLLAIEDDDLNAAKRILPEDCMLLSNLDGFLTGIVVGPEPIPSSEWMPAIWGGKFHRLDIQHTRELDSAASL